MVLEGGANLRFKTSTSIKLQFRTVLFIIYTNESRHEKNHIELDLIVYLLVLAINWIYQKQKFRNFIRFLIEKENKCSPQRISNSQSLRLTENVPNRKRLNFMRIKMHFRHFLCGAWEKIKVIFFLSCVPS